jgi:molybdenum cofactor guanylyltransferase
MQAEASSGITGVILAGGLSRRMGGGDKGLLELAGRPMLAHVIERLAPQVDALIINANGNPQRFAALGLPVVADTIAGFAGPLAGVLAGMRWAAANATDARLIVTVAGDAPMLPRDLAERLRTAVRDGGGRIALAQSYGALHPVIGLWPVDLADDLEAALRAGVRKVLDFTHRHGMACVPFAPVQLCGLAIDPFFNANTPAELEQLRALLARGGR